ncbi:MAG TPA: ABC transporter permease [Bryobacteraceae bacterium]|nr:ABC transporter permease [Bryobacteraceae bacterium]
MREQLSRDLAYAFRTVARKRGFAAMVVVILALGIGANAAVFSILDAVLIRPLPFRDARRFIAVWESDPKKLESTGIWNSWRDFQSWRRESRTVEGFAAYCWASAHPVMSGRGRTRSVFAVPVTPNFFTLLGSRAALGRTLEPQDKMGAGLAVLSYAFWQTEFGGAPGVLGKSVVLDHRAYTIIGVMPAAFQLYPKQMELWRPMDPADSYIRDSDEHSVVVVGRLQPGTRIAAAQEELSAIRANLNQTAPDGVPQYVPIVHGMQEDFIWLTGRNLSRSLILLMGAVGMLLLITCFNASNLLLVRGAERRKEFAIRAALGAGRAGLVRQQVTEALVLSGLGAALGVGLAAAAVRVFVNLNPVALPPGNPVTLNARVLLFSAVLAIVTTLFSGLIPAWRVCNTDLNEGLKDASKGESASALNSRSTRVLAVLENYHHPRHLMLNLLALDRMIARGGKPSGLLEGAPG